MKLTTKGRYAVSAMMDIAMQGDSSLVPLSEISARQGISISYLEQLFSKLKKAGLVESVRGAHGGYKTSLPYTDISVFTIMSAVDEDINATQCSGLANCREGSQCTTHHLWTGLTQHIANYLEKISLADLLNNEFHEGSSLNELKIVPAKKPVKTLS